MEDVYFLLLQVNDSLFPIGGYTQSYGLETYIQKGLVHDGDSAKEYLSLNLNTSFIHSELLAIKLAYEYACAGNLDKLFDLEQMSKASKTPSELRSASTRLGSRFIKAIVGMNFHHEFLDKYCQKCKSIGTSHAVAYGVFCAVAGIDLWQALSTYLYSQTSSNVTTCVKLIPLSQTTGQQILYDFHEVFTDILKKLENMDENDLFVSCSGLDIRSMQHEVLYSRLYMS